MVELDTSYTFSRIPYMTYEALEEYAERVVGDFSPELLHNPGPIDVDRFLEYYLGLNVDFRKLCYNRRILGMTAFNDGDLSYVYYWANEVTTGWTGSQGPPPTGKYTNVNGSAGLSLARNAILPIRCVLAQ